MDVTYGLLSNLVKTKSIERILAPIASQVKQSGTLQCQSQCTGTGWVSTEKQASPPPPAPPGL